MALLIVGGDVLAAKITREITEIKEYFSNLIKLNMQFGSLILCLFFGWFCADPFCKNIDLSEKIQLNYNDENNRI
jgi:hypothetical protein